MRKVALALFAAVPAISMALGAGLIGSAHAGGFFGDGIEILCGGCGAGRALDAVNEKAKQANPEYGRWEEDLTNRVRKNFGLQPHCEPLYDRYGKQVSCQ